MGKINLANLKKTIYYLKRNGIKNACYAIRERLEAGKITPYSYVPISESEAEEQRRWSSDKKITFSIVVPAYRTNEMYLREMIQSVAEQTYPHWELVLADATEDESVKSAFDKIICDIKSAYSDAETMCDDKLRYVKLAENAGIAANTNQALLHATGDYIGLLDHDDVLTADALYEMAMRIEKGKMQGTELQMLYSDEDKCNGDRSNYFERNRKEEFNLDLLLSNNYICHFLVMKSELIKELGFRSEYDGAQDYDLVLRAAQKLMTAEEACRVTEGSKLHMQKEQIAYIPKVLYHWRCHTGSTAENPQSKQYAYDAGLRALQDFANNVCYDARAVHLKHLGFYMLEYPQGILESRKDLGAVGGRVLDGQRIIGGRMSSEGDVYYEGLPMQYSGYMNRAVLTQTAEAVDIRCIRVREDCRELFEKITGVPYREVLNSADMIFDASTLPEGADYRRLSLKLCNALKEDGYSILYYPSLETVWKGERL